MLTVLTAIVLLGGVQRIGAVAEKLVPFMCVAYVVAALLVLGIYADPTAFSLILTHAFNPVGWSGLPSC